MSSLLWKPELRDLAEFYPSENPAHTEFSVALRKLHIACVCECRMRSNLTKTKAQIRELTTLWDECEFTMQYLRTVNSTDDPIAIVADELLAILPQHRAKRVMMYNTSERLLNFAVHVQKQRELSALIRMCAQSLNLHYFKLKGLSQSILSNQEQRFAA